MTQIRFRCGRYSCMRIYVNRRSDLCERNRPGHHGGAITIPVVFLKSFQLEINKFRYLRIRETICKCIKYRYSRECFRTRRLRLK